MWIWILEKKKEAKKDEKDGKKDGEVYRLCAVGKETKWIKRKKKYENCWKKLFFYFLVNL